MRNEYDELRDHLEKAERLLRRFFEQLNAVPPLTRRTIDTDTPTGKLIRTIDVAQSQYEFFSRQSDGAEE